MSTSTRLTYDLYTYFTIFTKLIHVSINCHAKSTSLLRFLLHLSHLQIRYAFISFTHLYYTPRPFTLYFNVFITTCFTQNASHFQTLSLTLSFTRSYLHIHALLLPATSYFISHFFFHFCTQPTRYSRDFSLSAIKQAVFLLPVSPPAAPRRHSTCHSPLLQMDRPNILAANLYERKQTGITYNL